MRKPAWKTLGPALCVSALCVSAAMAGEPMVAPRDVLAVITADWTGDGGIDRAVLVQSGEGMAELLIYSEQEGVMTLVARTPSVAWAGPAWGMLPELALSPSGALQVVSMNEAIGRHRWRETLTIVYRDGGFVVGGYTNNAYDTLDPDHPFDCDINLLTGRGVFNNRPFSSPVRALPVEDWAADRYTPSVLCPGE